MLLTEKLIGFLAPPVCVSCRAEGKALCATCSSLIKPYGERCFRCASLSPGFKTCQSCRKVGSPGRVIITTVHEGLARELMRFYKYHQQRAAAQSIAGLIAETFQSTQNPSRNYLIAPVPTAAKRVRQRGFDNGVLLARTLAHILNLPCASLLARIGQTRQVGSARRDRLVQMEDAFRVLKPSLVNNREILLVDDVVTTGATLTAASKMLRQAGAHRVDALVFAKRL